MQNTKVNHSIFKTIGFLDYDLNFLDHIKNNNYIKKTFSQDTYNFLQNSYHSEYLNIMFSSSNEYGVNRYIKELNYEIEICNIDTKILLNSIELFLFNSRNE